VLKHVSCSRSFGRPIRPNSRSTHWSLRCSSSSISGCVRRRLTTTDITGCRPQVNGIVDGQQTARLRLPVQQRKLGVLEFRHDGRRARQKLLACIRQQPAARTALRGATPKDFSRALTSLDIDDTATALALAHRGKRAVLRHVNNRLNVLEQEVFLLRHQRRAIPSSGSIDLQKKQRFFAFKPVVAIIATNQNSAPYLFDESSPMRKFYYHPPPSPTKVARYLEESALPYQLVPVDIRQGDQHQPAYLAINPNGKTPALVD
jgi:hypothetical protein